MKLTTRFAPRLAAFLGGLSLAGSLLAISSAEAKIFRNAYVSFELPEKWNCTLEQTEWVCRTNDPGLAEAIIILTAKEVGPQDALPGYEAHLKQPRQIVSRTGSSVQSTVYKVEQKKVAGHSWVDGMHFSSEVFNYYTRYLATTKDRIAVLVTFSAHKLHYTKYSGDFFRAIESLRVIATRATMNNAGTGEGGNVFGGNLGDGAFPAEPGGFGIDGLGGRGGEGPGAVKSFLAILLIGAAVGFYLMIKRKGGKGKGGKRKR